MLLSSTCVVLILWTIHLKRNFQTISRIVSDFRLKTRTEYGMLDYPTMQSSKLSAIPTEQPFERMQRNNCTGLNCTVNESELNLRNQTWSFSTSSISREDKPVVSKLVYIKTYKTGSSTLQNILYRRAEHQNLTILFPKSRFFIGHEIGSNSICSDQNIEFQKGKLRLLNQNFDSKSSSTDRSIIALV